MTGALAAAVSWARADWRARWRSIVVAGLIAGIAGGLAVACVDGARRTDSALQRLREVTVASDAVVFPSQVGVYGPDWSGLARQPEVETLARWALVFGLLDGDPQGLVFAPVGDTWLNTVDRPIVVEGRMFDPGADDEVVVASDLARSERLSVGDTFDFTGYAAEDTFGGTEPPHGPSLTLRIVGVIHTSIEHLFLPEGLMAVSPGILTNHPELQPLENAVVRLRGGSADIPALQRDMNELVADGAPVLDLTAVSRRITTTTDVEHTVLLLMALAIGIAGLVLVGQMLNRSGSVIGPDARALGAMGMPRRYIAGAAALAHVPAAVAACLACVASAAALSIALPFGLARRVDPDPGLHLEVPILVPALVLTTLVVIGLAHLSAYRASTPGIRSTGGDTAALRWIRSRVRPTVGLGASLAFGRGRDANGAPVRVALIGAVVGVLGVAGAATVDAGLRDAVAHPERAGRVWDAELRTELELTPPEVTALAASADQLDVVDTAVEVNRVSVPVGGVGVPTYAIRDAGGPTALQLTLLDGRAPTARGEAALGPATAAGLGVGIGDTVPVADGAEEATVVGIALFPTDVHAGFDEGMWLLPGDLDRLVGGPHPGFLAVRFKPTTSLPAGVAALEAVAETVEGYVEPSEEPLELTYLRDVIPLPRWLAVVLAGLALAALAHVLTASARSNARDFAVLRALGVTRRGTRVIIHVQSVAMAVAGGALGIPLGIAVGRTGWRLIAESVPIPQVTPLALLALCILVPVVLLTSQAVAVRPSRRVRRLRPAEVLRHE